VPATIDHLLFGSPELELGIAEIERLTGARPAYGGQHLGLGTHNALLSLGARTYLEVIAPDPSQSAVAERLPYGLGSLRSPALLTWAAAPDDIESAVRLGREAGIDYGEVSAHSRRTADGGVVRWRLATRTDEEKGTDIVPFLIDWGATPHPSGVAPGGVALVAFRICAPSPGETRRQLRAIGVDVTVVAGESPGLEAVLASSSGREVVLRS
jgi:hypothetical protein